MYVSNQTDFLSLDYGNSDSEEDIHRMVGGQKWDVSETSWAHEHFHATRSSMARIRRGDDESGSSRKDKGKRALYDEDEIEVDTGLTDVEEDDHEPGYDD
ncbi:hypothetical protein E3N88_10080 [Mikania micrantha]|uniref:Uncharacterized protein n=1 Tax=Mikania micrantha TaxID=192012 RepID=A0A5N6PAS8_9ASTR|nr:hypothetical protein E3N88_10080 [Mikania micrantha]